MLFKMAVLDQYFSYKQKYFVVNTGFWNKSINPLRKNDSQQKNKIKIKKASNFRSLFHTI
ncbi:hypothetical protein ZPR_0927 [Zunongwangia profunda SM-A87]|uniref:Uncharacterized protein n=1 Tax=Zunongwangia profunda (strain DSM 18752 / CCTCC AB 206139 / SM-A87) TaxID=655815 RepID=D5BHA0_ZUNPS|nr:hypothetical protein ZPR_0927 [Zunongwangia profunda SM-A87]